MATITANISASEALIPVSEELDIGYYAIDDENIRVTGMSRGADGRDFERRTASVDRGVGGTTAVTHTSGATLTRYYLEAAVAEGSPAFVHYSEADPGAVGAGHIWIKFNSGNNSYEMRIRSDDDSEWLGPSLIREAGVRDVRMSLEDDNLVLEAIDVADSDKMTRLELESDMELKVTDTAGVERARIHMSDSALHVQSRPAAEVEAIGVSFYENTVDVYLPATARLDLYTISDFSTRAIIFGTADPSAGAGVVAPVGSTYSRDNAGTGTLWLKTGAADTAWAQVTTS